MKQIISIIKPYLRWFILGGTLFFLAKTFKERVAEITTITIDSRGWSMVAIGLIVTLLAHIWSAWVWTWILKAFNLSWEFGKGIRVYLVTNIAKYLPGNVWHFYGRITAISQKGGSWSTAISSVLLEPLLMAASALLIAIVSTSLGLLETDFNLLVFFGQIAALLAVLIGIHPQVLNPILQYLSKGKKIKNQEVILANSLNHYPLMPFLGEMGFVLFRGVGFLFTVMALQQITLSQIIVLLSAFSIAWLLGLIIPGAPGGVGVFEATAIALLDQSLFSPATILVAVAIYRVISILAEAIAAGGAWIIDRTAT